jgi:hypothetical protein
MTTNTELAVRLVQSTLEEPIGPDPENENLRQTAALASVVVTPVIEQNGQVAVSQREGSSASSIGCFVAGFFASPLIYLGMHNLMSEDNTPEARLSGMIQLGTGIGLAVCSLCCCAAQICAR